MLHRRWLLLLQTCPSDDESGFFYQFVLRPVDAPHAPPVVVRTIDELLDALLEQGMPPVCSATVSTERPIFVYAQGEPPCDPPHDMLPC